LEFERDDWKGEVLWGRVMGLREGESWSRLEFGREVWNFGQNYRWREGEKGEEGVGKSRDDDERDGDDEDEMDVDESGDTGVAVVGDG
jgi:hypothetical protein